MDLAARNAVVMANRGLAVTLAARFRGRARGVEFADLEQAAMLGLIHAVDRYDAGRETPFGKFATAWILKELLAEIARMRYPITLPHNVGRGRAEYADARRVRGVRFRRGLAVLARLVVRTPEDVRARSLPRVGAAVSALPAGQRRLIAALYGMGDEPTRRLADLKSEGLAARSTLNLWRRLAFATLREALACPQ